MFKKDYARTDFLLVGFIYNVNNITVKVLRILKFAVINLAVFAVLLIVVNWACGVYLKKVNRTDRAALPNFTKNYEHAKAVFADYHRVQHRYEPFVGWKAMPYRSETTHISEAGLRTHQRQAVEENPGKTVRFFGGSTMWGEGSDDQHTIPALFNTLQPEYEVYNHGQLAYNTRQELDQLISVYSKNEKTDLVIFYDGVNDAAFLCPRVIEELPAHRLVPMYREKLYTRKSAIIKELTFDIFVKHSLGVIQKISRQEPENSLYDCAVNADKAEGVAEMMMKNWEMAHEIVTSRNGQFIAVLQPAAFIGNPRTDHLELDEELGKDFREIYKRVKQKIADRKHPWIVDLSAKFDSDEYVFIDFCHVSPNGNEIIAREISNAVSNLEE
ncbi:MAG: SGNH/GDSL hydrolase family protein [Cyclobacteriaceae bacterium]